MPLLGKSSSLFTLGPRLLDDSLFEDAVKANDNIGKLNPYGPSMSPYSLDNELAKAGVISTKADDTAVAQPTTMDKLSNDYVSMFKGLKSNMGSTEPFGPPIPLDGAFGEPDVQGLDNNPVKELVKAVDSGRSNIKKVTFPSGLSLESDVGTALDKSIPRGDKEEAPELETESQPYVEAPEVGNNNWNSLDTLSWVLAKLGQGLGKAGGSPFAEEVGGLVAGLSENEAYGLYLDDLRTGKHPGSYAKLLSAESKDMAQDRVQAERLLSLKETEMGIQADYTKALTAGTLTKGEKLEEAEKDRQLQRDLADQDIAAKLKLGEMRNKWMKADGMIFNWETGEVKEIGLGGTHSLGNINSSLYNNMTKAVVAEFLPKVYKKHEEEFKAKGWLDIVQMKKALTNDKGEVDYTILFPDLTPEERAMFGDRLAQYTMNHYRGKDYTVTFAEVMSDQAKAARQDLVKPKEVEQADWDSYDLADRRKLVDYFNKKGKK